MFKPINRNLEVNEKIEKRDEEVDKARQEATSNIYKKQLNLK